MDFETRAEKVLSLLSLLLQKCLLTGTTVQTLTPEELKRTRRKRCLTRPTPHAAACIAIADECVALLALLVQKHKY
jgi:hypothetical protein